MFYKLLNKFRSKLSNIYILLLIQLAIHFQCYSKTIIVGEGQEYTHLGWAIVYADEGDEIIVMPGSYYSIGFQGVNLYVHSSDPDSTDTVSKTIISGTSGYVVEFDGSEKDTCILEGFTLWWGHDDYFDGGCIKGNGTHATIRKNVIKYNKAPNGGGIAYCDGLIEDNTIMNNTATKQGGGLYNCHGIIRNNIIKNNSAGDWGGGISWSEGIIQNNIITENINNGISIVPGQIINNIISKNIGAGISTLFVGGIVKNNLIYANDKACFSCSGNIINNIIYGHKSQSYTIADCNGIIKNNIIWGNEKASYLLYNSSLPTYSCIQDWTGGGEGNISVDPGFIDAANGDFRLMNGSPCIDAGNPAAEYFDACIPPGRGTVRNDMGAYGGPQNCGWDIKIDKMVIIGCILGFDQITPSILPLLDQNNDSKIDISDLIIFVNKP